MEEILLIVIVCGGLMGLSVWFDRNDSVDDIQNLTNQEVLDLAHTVSENVNCSGASILLVSSLEDGVVSSNEESRIKAEDDSCKEQAFKTEVVKILGKQ
jgi:hypothetical protein